MGLFISYSSHDSAALSSLLSALRRAREEVWFDNELSGGEEWWGKILERIRDCDVFIFAISTNSLKSKACLSELRYARELHKPILPVQIGPASSMRVTPLADLEAIDYQNPTIDSGIRLTVAVREAREHSGPLPSPLPEEPPVPFAYLMRLGTTITDPGLDPRTQATLVAELKSGLEEDGDDPTARQDIIQLLCALRDRPDVTYRTRGEVDALLAAEGRAPDPAYPVPSPGFRVVEQPIYAGPGYPPAARIPPPGPLGAYPNGPQKKRSTKWIVTGGITAAIVSAVLAIVLTNIGRDRTARPTPKTTASRLMTQDELNATLLGAEEISTIMGATAMTASEIYTAMADSITLSKPSCLGAAYLGQKAVYEGSGWLARSRQTFNQPSADNPEVEHLYADELAVSFPSEDQARAFLERSTDAWKACAGLTATEADSTTWIFDSFGSDGETTALRMLQEGATGWACQRALTAYSNLVFEATACSDNVGDEATRILTQLVAKARG